MTEDHTLHQQKVFSDLDVNGQPQNKGIVAYQKRLLEK